MGHGLDLTFKATILPSLLGLASGEGVLVFLPLHHLVGDLHSVLLALLVPSPLVDLSFSEARSF
jgi:hypothetical protein